jgi:hypothetical protein
MKNYVGHCHCGAVKFEALISLQDPFQCNCSFCVRKGAVMHRTELGSFRLTSADPKLTPKLYGSKNFAQHYFCPQCGIQCFTDIRRNGQQTYAVNLACIDGMSLNGIAPRMFDGASLP